MDDSAPVMDRYRLALGRFIHDFAILEASIFDLPCAVAGVSDEIGGALFSGTRAEQTLSFIKRCYEVRELEIPLYVLRAADQVGLLNSGRNDAVHFPTFSIEDDEDHVVATNALRALPARRRDGVLSPADLEAMARDARILPAYFTVAACELREPDSTETLSEEMRGSQPPWTYKPDGPGNPRRRG